MVVIDVVDRGTLLVPTNRRDAIEMRVDQPGMIVMRSRAVPRVDVLKRRQQKSQRKSDASQQSGEAAHPRQVYTRWRTRSIW